MVRNHSQLIVTKTEKDEDEDCVLVVEDRDARDVFLQEP